MNLFFGRSSLPLIKGLSSSLLRGLTKATSVLSGVCIGNHIIGKQHFAADSESSNKGRIIVIRNIDS